MCHVQVRCRRDENFWLPEINQFAVRVAASSLGFKTRIIRAVICARYSTTRLRSVSLFKSLKTTFGAPMYILSFSRDVPQFLGPVVSGKMALNPKGRADEEEPIY